VAQQELTMTRLAFAAGLLALALGFAPWTPARADFAVVQFGDGYFRIWRDSAADPWCAHWKKIVVGLPELDRRACGLVLRPLAVALPVVQNLAVEKQILESARQRPC
jgi:hypothetical protein